MGDRAVWDALDGAIARIGKLPREDPKERIVGRPARDRKKIAQARKDAKRARRAR